MSISVYLTQIFNFIDRISGGNQIVAGAISLGLMGAMTYFLKNVPVSIYNFIKKHLTTELTTTSQHIVFHNLLGWLEKNGYSAKFRKIKLTNGRFGWAENAQMTKSVGYGDHLVWYCGRPILISLNKEETKSELDKETISLLKLGRSHDVFDKLISEISTTQDTENNTKVYRYNKSWDFIGLQPKRTIESVIVNKESMLLLKKTLDDFRDSESWYIEHGIPYQLGILLHGPPGTGKTSLLKAIAGHANKSICVASLDSVDRLEDILLTSPEDSIVFIEDVDTTAAVRRRDSSPQEPKDLEKERMNILATYMGSSLSDILNAIDGVMSKHGRILVMTTNHPEKIDKAVLRPGRVDLKLEIGYLDIVTFCQFLKKFFDDIPKGELDGLKLNTNKLTGSELQGDIRNNMSWENIVEKYTEPFCQ